MPTQQTNTTGSTNVKADVYVTLDGEVLTYAEAVARQPERTEAEWQHYERRDIAAQESVSGTTVVKYNPAGNLPHEVHQDGHLVTRFGSREMADAFAEAERKAARS